MVAQPVAKWNFIERGRPVCVLESSSGLLVGTAGIEPHFVEQVPYDVRRGWMVGKRSGTQAPLWRLAEGQWQRELTDYDGVVALVEHNNRVWALAYRTEWESNARRHHDFYLLAYGQVWAEVAYCGAATEHVATGRFPSLPVVEQRIVPTREGLYIIIGADSYSVFLWSGALRQVYGHFAEVFVEDGQTCVATSASAYQFQQDWRGPQVYHVYDAQIGKAGVSRAVTWRGRTWCLRQLFSPLVAADWTARELLRLSAGGVFKAGYWESRDWTYLEGSAVPCVPIATARGLYWLLFQVVAERNPVQKHKLLCWDGRQLSEVQDFHVGVISVSPQGPSGTYAFGVPLPDRSISVLRPGLDERDRDVITAVLPSWDEPPDLEVELYRLPVGAWIFNLAVDWGDGSGEHRPKLSSLRLDYRPSRRWDNEPTMRGLSIDWSDGSGSHKPKLDSLAVQYSDGSGEHRPTLTSLSVGYEAEGTAGTEQPRLQRLQVEWALRRGWVGEGERVLVLKPFEAPEGEWWALHVHTNLTREEEEQCRLLVRAEPCEKDVDDWESYRTHRLGWRVYLPVAAGSVRVAVVGPDTLPDDVEVFAQFVR